MADMEKKLQADEEAAGREIDITSLASNGTNGQRHDRIEEKSEPRTCKKCGYMSSQEICKACVLLEGLNKNRPKMEIEVDVEEEEESSTLRRRMEGLALAAG
ncbi:pp-loop atpase superfamily protein [Rutstroemia sp. NJR-2017a BBW]|nr:pp-loop atpase superfamily protein [Rutstroemia sp. NJR-2017a BBW]